MRWVRRPMPSLNCKSRPRTTGHAAVVSPSGTGAGVRGRRHEALACIEAALARWPTDAPLHALLAELRGARRRVAPTARLEQAIHAYPAELKLRLVAADAVAQRGICRTRAGIAGRGPAPRAGVQRLPHLHRRCCSTRWIGRRGAALSAQAVARAPGSVPARRNLVPTLLRLAEPREALNLCDELLAQLPDDQQLIAYRATALRALGDPGYSQLHDYARLVRAYHLRSHTSRGNRGIQRRFRARTRGLHRCERRPLDAIPARWLADLAQPARATIRWSPSSSR